MWGTDQSVNKKTHKDCNNSLGVTGINQDKLWPELLKQVTRNTTTGVEYNKETEPKNHIQQTSKSTCN
jgi:hypothetical protein